MCHYSSALFLCVSGLKGDDLHHCVTIALLYFCLFQGWKEMTLTPWCHYSCALFLSVSGLEGDDPAPLCLYRSALFLCISGLEGDDPAPLCHYSSALLLLGDELCQGWLPDTYLT